MFYICGNQNQGIFWVWLQCARCVMSWALPGVLRVKKESREVCGAERGMPAVKRQ